MEPNKIYLISIDEIWNTLEYQIIDTLTEYDCLTTINKDSKLLIGNILLQYFLKKITTCSITFENTPSGITTSLNSIKNPFVIFYFDEDLITSEKEILEYIDFDSFIRLLKELIRDCNLILNNRIIFCKFPYKFIKNISLGMATTTPSELTLKVEIMLQFYQQKKLSMNKIQKIASKYDIELSELDKRKIMS
jgi:hypothetical protein